MTMNSLFSDGELPPRKCENMDTETGTIGADQVAATECHQRNFRDVFQRNKTRCSSGESFDDLFPDVHDVHREGGRCGAGHVQRAPVLLTCSCGGQPPELFYDHDHHQSTSLNRYYHGMTGSSTTSSNQTGHLHNVCDRSCCASVAIRRTSISLANCGVDRARTTSPSSLCVDSLELQRNVAAVGSLCHYASTPREVETKTSSLHKGSMANFALHSQTKAANNQIVLYGWFLMKPFRESYTSDPSSFSNVAIGGYRCSRMEEKDFFGTATVVRRLERWKVQTNDNLEVGLMGMINIERSVANGFSPSLVQCFMIGFPSAWVYMLLNLQRGVAKGSSPGLLSPSACPIKSAGPTGVIRSPQRDGHGIFTTVPTSTNPVQSILQSSLFTEASGLEIKSATLRRCSTATTSPSLDGVSSDANSVPQVPSGKDQVDAVKGSDAMFREADFASLKATSHPAETSSGRACSPSIDEVVLTRCPHGPETSCQAQIPSKLEGCPSGTDDVKVEDGSQDCPGPSSIATENTSGEVHVEILDGRAANHHSDTDSALLGLVAPDDVPGTPLMQTRKRLRSDTDTPVVDTSSIEPVDRHNYLQNVKVNDVNSQTPTVVVNTPITVSVGHPSSPARTKGRRKRRSESDSHLPDIAVVEQIAVSPVDPSGPVESRDRRKRRKRRKSLSPVSDPVDPLVGVPDPVGSVKTSFRSRPQRESYSPVDDIPVVEPISLSVPCLVGSVKFKDVKLRQESHSSGTDIPAVEPETYAVADPVGLVQTENAIQSRSNKSNLPVADTPLEEPFVGIGCSFRRGASQVDAASDAAEEGAHAELYDELGNRDAIRRVDLDVGVHRASKDPAEARCRARRKRYKISRNYYQRVKKLCFNRPNERGPSKSNRSAAIRNILKETKVEIAVSRAVEENIEALKNETTTTIERDIPEGASSAEVPEGLTESSRIKRTRQMKKSIVPPPLPQPRVVDKSKVTEAFGLKRSLHGRVLVPPLATWRNQSIKYDMDGGIIAISDGFTGCDDERCTGYYNFKPPAGKGARTMRRRLCKAADEGTRKK